MCHLTLKPNILVNFSIELLYYFSTMWQNKTQVMILLILYLIVIFTVMTVYWSYIIIYKICSKIKIIRIFEDIDTLDDLLYLNFNVFIQLIAEMFRRHGYCTKITTKCGEEGNGLILDNIKFVEVWRRALHREVECETAMKFARCMQLNSIYRGMLITLGDFKQSTRIYCHKNVIECINGQQLIAMFREVQKKRKLLKDVTILH